MTKEQQRDNFESWIMGNTHCPIWRTSYPMMEDVDQHYVDHSVDLAWMAWQAALEVAK